MDPDMWTTTTRTTTDTRRRNNFWRHVIGPHLGSKESGTPVAAPEAAEESGRR